MAVVRIPDENRALHEVADIKSYLANIQIDYECWKAEPVAPDAPPEEILAAYSEEIQALKECGGYVTADVIDVSPATPNLDAMLAKFNREHWHDEDEVRFIIHGRGLFHIHPSSGPFTAIEVEAGDLIRVPRGTRHCLAFRSNYLTSMTCHKTTPARRCHRNAAEFVRATSGRFRKGTRSCHRYTEKKARSESASPSESTLLIHLPPTLRNGLVCRMQQRGSHRVRLKGTKKSCRKLSSFDCRFRFPQ
jgi:1,2-dihydroxy-3-keto-5-methylthiopentene dioxygenase